MPIDSELLEKIERPGFEAKNSDEPRPMSRQRRRLECPRCCRVSGLREYDLRPMSRARAVPVSFVVVPFANAPKPLLGSLTCRF